MAWSTFYSPGRHNQLMRARYSVYTPRRKMTYGVAHPTRQLPFLTQCAVCGNAFHTAPSRRGFLTLCGRSCLISYHKMLRRGLFAGNRPSDGYRADTLCLCCPDCGVLLDRPFVKTARSGIGQEALPYCRECFRKRIPRVKSPQHRGDNWHTARRAAIERDKGMCRHCATVLGESLHVHHIKPFRCYKDSRRANALANLISLCGPCHVKAEKIARKNHPPEHKKRPKRRRRRQTKD